MTEKQIIESCRLKDRNAQRILYQRYAPKFYGLCRRYIKDDRDAEEVLVNAFYKVFTKLNQFANKGSFEGWMRRIMVTESLMFLRKHNMNLSIEVKETDSIDEALPDAKLMENDILQLLNELPVGYRTIFNLYAIEGFSHKEIADKLNISINTSKSQLLKARKKMKALLIEQKHNAA